MVQVVQMSFLPFICTLIFIFIFFIFIFFFFFFFFFFFTRTTLSCLPKKSAAISFFFFFFFFVVVDAGIVAGETYGVGGPVTLIDVGLRAVSCGGGIFRPDGIRGGCKEHRLGEDGIDREKPRERDGVLASSRHFFLWRSLSVFYFSGLAQLILFVPAYEWRTSSIFSVTV